jgi:cobyrinic acid a,c-diamide synthase
MSPRLLIAGVSSGVGKTTFTLGLCRALMRRGYDVSVFKCGPDYLDPGHHRVASKRRVHNLDSWLMGESAVRSAFLRNAGQISLIEGVMGLFDGASPTALTGSSAEIARILQANIVLVCDASGMARSVAALAHGFASFEPSVSVRALICNRIGSASHLELLRRACPVPPVLGGMIEQPALTFPERHLGLHAARELDLESRIEGWADQVEAQCDVPALIELAHAVPALEQAPEAADAQQPRRCKIGLAEDDAFHFYYDENLRLLERAGAELVRFSPQRDRALPACDGLYFGGGYPELHAATLAANGPMLTDIRAFARAGKPIYGECGGLMYLARTISVDGTAHPMLGLIDGDIVMTERLQALGYVEVETTQPTLLGPTGTQFRGHQFRYSRFDKPPHAGRYNVARVRTGAVEPEGYGISNVLGSYVHAHWASNPAIPEAFVTSCVTARDAP